MTGPQYRGRTREIIRLARAGHRQSEIARVLGCKPQNVNMTLKRHAITINLKGPPLTAEQVAYIEAEAAKEHVTFDDMARAMLSDYLQDNVSRVSSA